MTEEQAREYLRAEGVDEDTILKFFEWQKKNRNVWKEFEEMTLFFIALGEKSRGAKSILEIVRYERAKQKRDAFKVNNNYGAYMARIFMAKYQHKTPHNSFFKTREVKGLRGEKYAA
jgi:hypothetical protein